jgi:hypothetical protein
MEGSSRAQAVPETADADTARRAAKAARTCGIA